MLTCTVICGMSMSGISDTGMFRSARKPITLRAMMHMVTAMGRLSRVLFMCVC